MPGRAARQRERPDLSVPSIAAEAAEIVHVPLGERAYDIVIGRGVLEQAGARIAALAPGAACAIVTDEIVAAHHLAALAGEPRERAGVRSTAITIPPGEASKSYAMFETVCDAIIAARMERGDLVVALGGGVVGDLAGFAAAVVRRGDATSCRSRRRLLAQVDSSVGGKTGINSPHGKNLVGAFHQPSARPGRPRRARHAARARVPRRLRRGGQIRPDRRSPASSNGWRATARRSSPADPSAAAAVAQLRAEGRRSWRGTSARRATARCSISATPSRHALERRDRL